MDPAVLDPSQPGETLDPVQLQESLAEPSGVAESGPPSVSAQPDVPEPPPPGQDVDDTPLH